MIIQKGRNSFQKIIKEKDDIKNHLTALAARLKMKK